jgi:hypothetical protein
MPVFLTLAPALSMSIDLGMILAPQEFDRMRIAWPHGTVLVSFQWWSPDGSCLRSAVGADWSRLNPP